MTGSGRLSRFIGIAPRTSGGIVDPIFGKPMNFYPIHSACVAAHRRMAAYAGLIACALAAFFILVTGGARVLAGRLSRSVTLPWRGFSIAFAFLLLVLAMRVYLGRFERLLDEHTIFGGVTYTDAHITLTGMLVVCGALVLGAVIASINAVRVPRGRWLVAAMLQPRSVMLPFKNCVVRQQLYRQAQRTRSREAVHCLQHRSDAAEPMD